MRILSRNYFLKTKNIRNKKGTKDPKGVILTKRLSVAVNNWPAKTPAEVEVGSVSEALKIFGWPPAGKKFWTARDEVKVTLKPIKLPQ